MGVKDLWSVLEPVKEGCSWEALAGLTLAVDLSGWIMQSTQHSALQSVRAPHIRNLFFRICQLHRCQVKLVFVLDGPAPKLKEQTLERRRTYAGHDTPGKATATDNGRFNKRAHECCEVLSAFGVPFIESPGEAEALCAHLNRSGVVDGVITDDGDAFLFGAKVVYPNFTSDIHKEESLERYAMADIESKVHLSREHLVAFALLTGCDYSVNGVVRVGRERALALLNKWPEQPIERLKNWRSDKRWDELTAFKEERKPSHCGKCQHPGTVQAHKHSGCTECGGDCVRSSDACHCSWHQQNQRYIDSKLELGVRNKAMDDPQFPNQEVIDAFANGEQQYEKKDFTWNKPDPLQLLSILTEKLNYEQDKAVDKMLPLLTSHDIYNTRHGSMEDNFFNTPRIVKQRCQVGKMLYEVEWDVREVGSEAWCSVLKTPNPDTQLKTLEYQTVFKQSFPKLSEEFDKEQELLKSPAKKTKKEVSTPKVPSTLQKTSGKKRRNEADSSQTLITDMFPVKKKQNLPPKRDQS